MIFQKKNKWVYISIALGGLFLFSLIQFLIYFNEYRGLKNAVAVKLSESQKKAGLYEQIILKYEYMDFKIFAFEKKYPEFAKIVHRSFQEAKKNEISPYTVLSVIQVESNFDPQARSSVASGLMQINLSAWKEHFKIEENRIFEIDYNITLGCKILKHYLDESKGDIAKALYLYNNGYGFHNEKYVPKVQSSVFSKN